MVDLETDSTVVVVVGRNFVVTPFVVGMVDNFDMFFVLLRTFDFD